MAVPPGTNAAYLSQPGQNASRLAQEVNKYRDMFRRDGGVLREYDSTTFAAAVYSYLFTISYNRFRRTMSETESEDRALSVACRVARLALTERHFRKWVLGDRRAEASTYLFKAAMWAMNTEYRRAGRDRRFVQLSQALSAGSESEDEGEVRTLEPRDQMALPVDTKVILSIDMSPQEMGLAGLDLAEIAAITRVSIPTACRRRQKWRAKLKSLLAR